MSNVIAIGMLGYTRFILHAMTVEHRDMPQGFSCLQRCILVEFAMRCHGNVLLICMTYVKAAFSREMSAFD